MTLEEETLTEAPKVRLAEFVVPTQQGEPASISAEQGRLVTLVGANGAGKSALTSWMVKQLPPGKAKRLIAHRRVWFSASGPEISPAQRARQGQNAETWDRSEDSRYADHLDGNRTNIALFDLLGMINDQNRAAVELYDSGMQREHVIAATGERLLPKLNRILASAGLHVSIRVGQDQTFYAQHTTLGVEYPVQQMSDGERNALLLAGEILTAPEEMVLILDEPERHLHRAISARLVAAMITERPDCAFVLATHDLDLALYASAHGSTFVLSGCSWTGAVVSAWEIHELAEDEDVPDHARAAILGGRKQVLFVEGDGGSIDSSLYGVLYPGRTCTPVGGCDAVIKAVAGVRTSHTLHWVSAVGIIDGDGRSSFERASLARRGILALGVSEVENLYYLPAVVAAVASAQVDVLGGNKVEMIDAAQAALIDALSETGVVDRVAQKLAVDQVHRTVVDHIPSSVTSEDVSIALPSPLVEIREKLQRLCDQRDYGGLVTEVPIRDSAARSRLARAMHFASVDLYEQAAHRQISLDEALQEAVREAVGILPD